ncbi:hypothetical protein [Natrialba asiatica]|nr:hypothetical protein [Natrialba asiatica]
MESIVETERYWEIKGIGRIILLFSIFVYGVGLLLLRAHEEKKEAEGGEE